MRLISDGKSGCGNCNRLGDVVVVEFDGEHGTLCLECIEEARSILAERQAVPVPVDEVNETVQGQ